MQFARQSVPLVQWIMQFVFMADSLMFQKSSSIKIMNVFAQGISSPFFRSSLYLLASVLKNEDVWNLRGKSELPHRLEKFSYTPYLNIRVKMSRSKQNDLLDQYLAPQNQNSQRLEKGGYRTKWKMVEVQSIWSVSVWFLFQLFMHRSVT